MHAMQKKNQNWPVATKRKMDSRVEREKKLLILCNADFNVLLMNFFNLICFFQCQYFLHQSNDISTGLLLQL